MRLVACALVVACCAVACSTGGGSEQSTATTTTTAPSTTAPDPTCAAFHGTEGPLQSFGDRPESLLVDAYVEQVGCLDRVTFEFRSIGDGLPPGYTVSYRDLEQDPIKNSAGGNVELPTRMALLVEMKPAHSSDVHQPDAPPTYLGPTRLSYGATHHIEIVQQLPDTADSVVWAIGVDSTRPFVVDSAMNPTRVSVYIG